MIYAPSDDVILWLGGQANVLWNFSAGIGRTGCFIATSIGMRQLKEENFVNILGIVCQMRQDRYALYFGHMTLSMRRWNGSWWKVSFLVATIFTTKVANALEKKLSLIRWQLPLLRRRLFVSSLPFCNNHLPHKYRGVCGTNPRGPCCHLAVMHSSYSSSFGFISGEEWYRPLNSTNSCIELFVCTRCFFRSLCDATKHEDILTRLYVWYCLSDAYPDEQETFGH